VIQEKFPWNRRDRRITRRAGNAALGVEMSSDRRISRQARRAIALPRTKEERRKGQSARIQGRAARSCTLCSSAVALQSIAVAHARKLSLYCVRKRRFMSPAWSLAKVLRRQPFPPRRFPLWHAHVRSSSAAIVTKMTISKARGVKV